MSKSLKTKQLRVPKKAPLFNALVNFVDDIKSANEVQERVTPCPSGHRICTADMKPLAGIKDEQAYFRSRKGWPAKEDLEKEWQIYVESLDQAVNI